MKKRLFSLMAAGILTCGLLTGCSTSTEENQNDDTEQMGQNAPESEDTNSDESSNTDNAGSGEGQKTLVVYFSATGNTEQVANVIAETAGGELFGLEPVEPYTDDDLDWTDDNSRVTKEHENPDQREIELVKTTVEDWQDVSVVYIGYPVWWGIAAWPVDSFVKANDFTGKTVIPFCTSSSSGLGESGELLAEMAGTGEWQEGMRFQSSVSDEDVQAWVKS